MTKMKVKDEGFVCIFEEEGEEKGLCCYAWERERESEWGKDEMVVLVRFCMREKVKSLKIEFESTAEIKCVVGRLD